VAGVGILPDGHHYHLLIETLQPTLSRGMREVNGVYTQAFNRRHDRVGHVLQGRYKAILVDKDSYLPELARYIVLNPVRARLCETAGDWPWSSHRAVMGGGGAGCTGGRRDVGPVFGGSRGGAAIIRALCGRRCRGLVAREQTAAVPWR